MQNYRQFTSWLNEAKCVREEDDEVEVAKKGKSKVVVHDGDEDGSRVTEELKGKQHKLDKNKNGRLDAHDFELLHKEEEELDEAQYGVNLGSRPVSGQKEYQGKEIKSFHPNKEKEAREFAKKHGYVVKKKMLAKDGNSSITHTWDIHKEEVELEEADQKIKVTDVKSALKNVKNASSHTKKMIKANPTQKMPYDSSRHAAYSEEVELDESWMSQRSSYDGPGKGKLLGDMSEKEHVDAINYHGNQIHQLKTGTHKYSKMYTKQQAADKLAQHMKHYTDHKDAYDAHTMNEEVELDEGIKSMVHSYLAKRAGKKADDAYDMGDEKEFQKQVDKSEYHRVKAGGKPTRINKNPDSKFLTTREEVELDENVKIIDRDSDLDQEHFKLSVNGKPVHFVHHNYEGGHATDSKQDIHYQVKNQLKHLSDADKKKVTDAVHASYRMKEEAELDEGQTVKTSTGYVHKGSYGSEYDTDEEGNEKKKTAPAVKRGRGRPKKGSDETGEVKKYTFHDLLNRLSR